MTLTRLSGAKSLRDSSVSQLLGQWVASSPLAKAQWYEVTFNFLIAGAEIKIKG